MWRRLVAGGVLLICVRVIAALSAAGIVKAGVLSALGSLLEALPRNPFHEAGDIQLPSVLLAIVLYGGVFLAFLITWVLVYVGLSRMPVSAQIGVGVLLMVPWLALENDRLGHYALRSELIQFSRNLFRPAPVVPPFSIYMSPAKEREIRWAGSRRMQVEWVGEKLQVTNRTTHPLWLRIDFHGAYGQTSSIQCRGDRRVPTPALQVVQAGSIYSTNRIVCGDGFKYCDVWAWDSAGELIAYETKN